MKIRLTNKESADLLRQVLTGIIETAEFERIFAPPIKLVFEGDGKENLNSNERTEPIQDEDHTRRRPMKTRLNNKERRMLLREVLGGVIETEHFPRLVSAPSVIIRFPCHIPTFKEQYNDNTLVK